MATPNGIAQFCAIARPIIAKCADAQFRRAGISLPENGIVLKAPTDDGDARGVMAILKVYIEANAEARIFTITRRMVENGDHIHEAMRFISSCIPLCDPHQELGVFNCADEKRLLNAGLSADQVDTIMRFVLARDAAIEASAKD